MENKTNLNNQQTEQIIRRGVAVNVTRDPNGTIANLNSADRKRVQIKKKNKRSKDAAPDSKAKRERLQQNINISKELKEQIDSFMAKLEHHELAKTTILQALLKLGMEHARNGGNARFSRLVLETLMESDTFVLQF